MTFLSHLTCRQSLMDSRSILKIIKQKLLKTRITTKISLKLKISVLHQASLKQTNNLQLKLRKQKDWPTRFYKLLATRQTRSHFQRTPILCRQFNLQTRKTVKTLLRVASTLKLQVQTVTNLTEQILPLFQLPGPSSTWQI